MIHRMTLATANSRHFTWRASHHDRDEAIKGLLDLWNSATGTTTVKTLADLEEHAEVEILDLTDYWREQR